VRYEEMHPDKELGFDEALQLYLSYDLHWRQEVSEAKQFRRFAKNNGRSVIAEITGQDTNGEQEA
jgi:hypothetical protein